MYAANGIGMVLAEKGQFDMAKEIFTQVLVLHTHMITEKEPPFCNSFAH